MQRQFVEPIGPEDEDFDLESSLAKRTEQMNSTKQRINEIYASGTPLFTKDAMRETVRQIKAIEAAGKPGAVSIMGINGVAVWVPVRPTGKTDELWLEDAGGIRAEMHHCNPHILYRTIDHLTKNSDPASFNFRHAYLSMAVGSYAEYRDPETKAVIHPYSQPVSPPDREGEQSVAQPPDPSFEDVQDNLREKRAEWEGSEQYAQLKSILDAAKIAPVRKILGFACSSLAQFDNTGEMARRSTAQHILLLALRDILSVRIKPEYAGAIRCYVQDPAYTSIDRQVLEAEGVAVVEDPVGFLEADDESVVISFAPNIPVRQIIADIAKPAIMIWCKIKYQQPPALPSDGSDKPTYIQWADPVSPRLEKLAEDYVEVEFPGDLRNFSAETSIYIRKS